MPMLGSWRLFFSPGIFPVLLVLLLNWVADHRAEGGAMAYLVELASNKDELARYKVIYDEHGLFFPQPPSPPMQHAQAERYIVFAEVWDEASGGVYHIVEENQVGPVEEYELEGHSVLFGEMLHKMQKQQNLYLPHVTMQYNVTMLEDDFTKGLKAYYQRKGLSAELIRKNAQFTDHNGVQRWSISYTAPVPKFEEEEEEEEEKKKFKNY